LEHASLSAVQLFALYRRLIGSAFVQTALQRHRPNSRQRLYTVPVVFWLMIVQRLQAPGSLSRAVAQVRRSRLGPLLRRTVKKISRRTGGFCRARLRLPIEVIQELTDYLTSELERQLVEPGRSPVYILDGSSVTLSHQPELVNKYPPGNNQHGASHWPIVKMVVLHEARTGLAVAPAWGPMYGPQAVSEQVLAERLFPRLPAGATVLGDRNFGIFAMAYKLQQRQCDVVLRLTVDRAQKLLGGKVRAGMDERVVWKPSAADRKTNPDLPVEAAVAGRLIVAQWAGWREPVCLFTTLELAPTEVVELYGWRWNIETDLRSIKQTVRLQQITVKSNDMLEKELYVAIAAYNLVRAVICHAALLAKVHPRELSFTHVYYLIEACLPELLAYSTSARARRELNTLIREAASCRLPRRKKQRSYPRELWLRRRSYPVRKATAAGVK
jgi:hypothetical protein